MLSWTSALPGLEFLLFLLPIGKRRRESLTDKLRFRVLAAKAFCLVRNTSTKVWLVVYLTEMRYLLDILLICL